MWLLLLEDNLYLSIESSVCIKISTGCSENYNLRDNLYLSIHVYTEWPRNWISVTDWIFFKSLSIHLQGTEESWIK